MTLDTAIPPGLTAEVVRWAQDAHQKGTPPDAMIASLCKVGWSALLAQQVVEFAATGTLAPPEPVTKKTMPEPDLEAEPCSIDVGDRHVHVLLSMHKPRVVLFGNLLSGEECEAIIEAARPRMERSRTVARDADGEEVHDARTSDGMFFQRGETEVVQRLEARIARLVRWPLANGEGLQVLCYRPGAQYEPHHDYFDPTAASTPTILQRGGQRVGTLVIYLNETGGGGGTTFPERQLAVMPRRGNAVFFSYDKPDASTLTLHGGAPVKEGEKWIATKWLREGEFI